jgi:riboflavin synthase
MFTGIITDIGKVRDVEARGDLHLTIGCGYDMETIDLGASIACSGCCLTVVNKGPDWFAADVSAETVSKTAPGRWESGQNLNLERALKLGDELGGHIVTGHVDGVGRIVAVEAEGDSHRVRIQVGSDLAPYIAPKGSITVDGVSLTVNEVRDDDAGTIFGLNIIPHTWQETTFRTIEPNRPVNLEIDVLARYLARMQNRNAFMGAQRAVND